MRAAAAPYFLPALILAAMVLLPSTPAHALDKQVIGDVAIPEDQTVEEVRTAWGDVVVEGKVEEDVSSGVGDVLIRGPVGGDVEVGAGDVRVDAPVGGDVNVGNGDIYLESGAQVGGEISQGSGRLFRDDGADAGGKGTFGMASDFGEDSPLGAFSDWIGWGVMTLGLAAAAVLLAVAAPGPLRASARSLEGAPGRSLLLGVGSLPAMIVVSILLFFTVVGGLLLPLLWPAYLALVVFGALVAVYFLGRKVVLATGRYRAGDALAAVVGAVLVSAAYQIPFLGGLVFAGLVFLGTGASVLALLTRRRTRRPAYASYEEYLRARRDA